jgi:hypothetical protein
VPGTGRVPRSLGPCLAPDTQRSAATPGPRRTRPPEDHYHLRTLEAHGLVRVVDERRWGGLTERLHLATAAAYVVSPAALGEAASDPDRIADRLCARYLVSLAARIVQARA